ncbi:RagB/SusD family nutrient uptake outer membrane protein [Sabulibacter ruber]|uniref:RagB/SusD family nutrient uptake outer membrane protein n=1 Tax=Sabulibacter ruber TaxID=2811901 RepID=UPI001A9798D1|nr:RagB/SusD family nutrient uptake outer membrane protein [Sabulibacter ruber]
MNRFSQFAIYLLGALTVSLSACNDLEVYPESRFTEANYWTTTEKAMSVLNTAYSQMYRSDYYFYNEGMSDNAYNGRGDQNGVASLAAGTYDPSLSRIIDEWGYHYSGIKTCHIFLENVDRVEGMDPTLKERMKAEARFIRAFHYFQLLTWYGDVPLIERDPTVEEVRTVQRTPRAQVLEFVLNELTQVEGVLPINTAYAAADRGRITKGAAIALRARALLYEGRWQEVVTACESLMSNANGTYSLFPSYQGLFLPANENNNEVILDLQYVPQHRAYNHYFDMAPIIAGARLNNLAPTQELVDSYLTENGKMIGESGSGYDETNPYSKRDPRLDATIAYHNSTWTKLDGSVVTIYTRPGSAPRDANGDAKGLDVDEYRPGGVSSPTGYYFRKYYDRSSGPNFLSGLNLILIRYADVLLMYAEAKNELGQMNENVWSQTIGAIRSRAGFTDPGALGYPAVGQDGLRGIIRNERRIELAFENTRIFDIRRWRIAEQVLNGWAHGARYGSPSVDNGYIRVNQRSFDPSRHYLWPIPRNERALNPNLSQNPNW